jgi:hypothetical protein
LVKNVVFVGADKGGDVSYHRENVKFIAFNSVVGQEDVVQLQIEEMITHYPHHLVGLLIVHIQDVQVVETAVERLTDLELQIHHSVENS